MASLTSASETSVQNLIHSLEQGRFAGLIRAFLLIAIVLAIALAYLGWNFTGFSIPEAMDQAQVAREISRGHGFTTKVIRPLAIWQIEKNKGVVPRGRFPDTYNAPLPPIIDSIPVKLAGPLKYERMIFVTAQERAIVIVSMICFLLAVIINYFLLIRLFDRRLAILATLVTLFTDSFWQYTVSGLPQMMMLLFFSAALYAYVRALEAHNRPQARLVSTASGSEPPPLAAPSRSVGPAIALWLAISGACMGLMILCHALCAWIAVGAIIFTLLYFRGRRYVGIIFLIMCGLVYLPWAARTYRVSGSPFGLAGYAIFDSINSSTTLRMRSADGPNVSGVAPQTFRLKVEHGLVNQLQRVVHNQGGNIIAVLFFVGLLHPFRRPETAALRWAVLTMWLFAVFGMSIMGMTDEAIVGSARLGILFAPLMLGFGVAMTLILFARLEANNRSLVRFAFLASLLFISAMPMIVTLLPEKKPPHNFPPYFEPAIHALNGWTSDNEIIATDMPWAVAFYADRKSLWIPAQLRDLLGLSDQGKLDGDLAGVFLSPISRGSPFISSIYKGEYQDYGQLIFGNVNIPYFPFHEVVLPAGDLNYSFYSSTRRWDKPNDQ